MNIIIFVADSNEWEKSNSNVWNTLRTQNNRIEFVEMSKIYWTIPQKNMHNKRNKNVCLNFDTRNKTIISKIWTKSPMTTMTNKK